MRRVFRPSATPYGDDSCYRHFEQKIDMDIFSKGRLYQGNSAHLVGDLHLKDA